jgi:hypothetical protein
VEDAVMTDLMVTLRGVGAEFRLPSPWWVGLTNLAMQYGWTPSPASWSDREEHCCELVFDQVTDADAGALADALEQALPDILRHHIATQAVQNSGMPRLTESIGILHERPGAQCTPRVRLLADAPIKPRQKYTTSDFNPRRLKLVWCSTSSGPSRSPEQRCRSVRNVT